MRGSPSRMSGLFKDEQFLFSCDQFSTNYESPQSQCDHFATKKERLRSNCERFSNNYERLQFNSDRFEE